MPETAPALTRRMRNNRMRASIFARVTRVSTKRAANSSRNHPVAVRLAPRKRLLLGLAEVLDVARTAQFRHGAGHHEPRSAGNVEANDYGLHMNLRVIVAWVTHGSFSVSSRLVY